MFRRFLPLPSCACVLSLVACAQPIAPSTSTQAPAAPPLRANSYVCRPAGATNARYDQRVTVRPNEQGTGLQLNIGGRRDWHSLTIVASSSGRVYADDAYAWSLEGQAPSLTDIKNILTYACTVGPVTAARQAQ